MSDMPNNGASSMGQMPQLCDVCRRKVAKATITDQAVLPVLGQLGTSFCTFMSDNIFTQNTRQTIQRSRNDAEALGHIRDAFNNSLAPDMVDELLRVLRSEQIGKNDHANQIEEVYRKKIGDHRRCKMCRTGH